MRWFLAYHLLTNKQICELPMTRPTSMRPTDDNLRMFNARLSCSANGINGVYVWNTPCKDKMRLTTQSSKLLESCALKLLLFHEHSTKIHTRKLIFQRVSIPISFTIKISNQRHDLNRTGNRKSINLSEIQSFPWARTLASRYFYVDIRPCHFIVEPWGEGFVYWSGFNEAHWSLGWHTVFEGAWGG